MIRLIRSANRERIIDEWPKGREQRLGRSQPRRQHQARLVDPTQPPAMPTYEQRQANQALTLVPALIELISLRADTKSCSHFSQTRITGSRISAGALGSKPPL